MARPSTDDGARPTADPRHMPITSTFDAHRKAASRAASVRPARDQVTATLILAIWPPDLTDGRNLPTLVHPGALLARTAA
jgi:hypothetical protein